MQENINIFRKVRENLTGFFHKSAVKFKLIFKKVRGIKIDIFFQKKDGKIEIEKFSKKCGKIQIPEIMKRVSTPFHDFFCQIDFLS